MNKRQLFQNVALWDLNFIIPKFKQKTFKRSLIFN